MEDVIFEILASKSRREALKYLYASRREIPGRVLAREIGFSIQQTHNALSQLVSYGLVKCRKFPPIYLFSANLAAPLSASVGAALCGLHSGRDKKVHGRGDC